MSFRVGQTIHSPALIKSSARIFEFTPTVVGYVASVESGSNDIPRYTGQIAYTTSSPKVGAQNRSDDLLGELRSYRATYVSFDTSSLAGKTIILARLEANADNLSMTVPVQVTVKNFGPSITTADYTYPTGAPRTTKTFTTEGVQSFATGGSTTLGTSIQKTGITYYMLSHEHQSDGSPLPLGPLYEVTLNDLKLYVTAA